jgi:hypothetical protein
MKKQFTYFDGKNDGLCKLIGIEEEKCWDYMSLDDWDYALIFDGYIPPYKLEGEFGKLLQGCCSNDWVYFKKQDKTVGMAYHS